ncbi:MAG: hypothetical protein AB7G12_15120 [Thermoanaerobaculia bacterium]
MKRHDPRSRGLRPSRLFLPILLLLCVAPLASGEGFHIEVTAHPDYPSVAGKIAVLPPVAPPGVDPDWLAKLVAGRVSLRARSTLVGPQESARAIAAAGLDVRSDEGRAALGCELGVESLLEIRVSDVARWRYEEGEPREGTVLKKKRTDRARATVRLRIASADSNRMWFEGETRGTGIGSSEKPLVQEMLDRLLERSLPLRGTR